MALFGALPDAPGLWRTDGTEAGTYELVHYPNLPAFRPRILDVTYIASSGGVAWFALQDNVVWRLWRTDGTKAGTSIVATFQQSITLLTAIGDKVFFMNQSTATTTLNELWVCDSRGPRLVADIHGTNTPKWNNWTTLGNALYVGTEAALWKSDGTTGGTSKIANVPAKSPAATSSRLFFWSPPVAGGGEIWVSDGTSGGTRVVTSARPDGSPYTLLGMGAVGENAIFIGTNGELGVSDGTSGGTRSLHMGVAPSIAPQFASLNGSVYFGYDDGVHGRELWRSDGTDSGTTMVLDASDGASSGVNPILAGASRVYYLGSDRTHPADLFESDGTAAGTHVVHTGAIWKGTTLTVCCGSPLPAFVTIGDRVFFGGNDGFDGVEPFVSDGTDAGTHRIANLAPDPPGSSAPRNLMALAGRLLFVADGDEGPAIWSSDGTAGGTNALLRGFANSALLGPLGADGNTLYMTRGLQLLRSDGSPGHEVLIKDFKAGYNASGISQFGMIGSHACFLADDGNGSELWTTDGTEAGTIKLTPPYPGSPYRYRSLPATDRSYFLYGDFYGSSVALWASDGTIAGTRSVATPQGIKQVAAPLIPFAGSFLLFGAADPVTGNIEVTKMWTFSGDPGDAKLVRTMPYGAARDNNFTASIGSTLFFFWQQDSTTGGLWKTDGTDDGTVLVKAFPVVQYSVTASQLVSLGARVVFQADDGVHGSEPWVSDGTPDGTKMLRDIVTTGTGSSDPQGFYVADGIAYFSAVDGVHGRELWQTDGTPEGTQLMADIEPGSGGSFPDSFTRVGNLLYFAATTSPFGRELWAYQLPAPAITIDDARTLENAGSVAVPVRLTHASSQRITVGYETVDDSAKAGTDYTASSGTITFEAGETVKNILVSIANDNTLESTRRFFVRLKDATVVLERGTAAALIEDDDRAADLEILGSPAPLVTVRNNGPSLASNVVICEGAFDVFGSHYTCSQPIVLAVGQTASLTSLGYPLAARATAWERDPVPGNNAGTWIGSGGMYTTPAEPRAGQTSTLFLGQYPSSAPSVVAIGSSDPTILSVPASVTFPANVSSATTTLNALKAGTATITAHLGAGVVSLPIHVIGATDPPRIPSVTSFPSLRFMTFAVPNVLTAKVDGRTADGILPSGGTVTFLQEGQVLGQSKLVGGLAALTFSNPTPGYGRQFTAQYSGDANFEDSSRTVQLLVDYGKPLFSATRVPGSSSVEILVRGIEGFAPAGFVSLLEDGTVPRGSFIPLVKSSNANSTVIAGGFSAAARTVTVTYATTDSYYEGTAATIPIVAAHDRVVRH